MSSNKNTRFSPEERKASVELNKPIAHLMAVNRFKSLKQKRIQREQANGEAASRNYGAVETDAETKKENRISIQSIPEDDDDGEITE